MPHHYCQSQKAQRDLITFQYLPTTFVLSPTPFIRTKGSLKFNKVLSAAESATTLSPFSHTNKYVSQIQRWQIYDRNLTRKNLALGTLRLCVNPHPGRATKREKKTRALTSKSGRVDYANAPVSQL